MTFLPFGAKQFCSSSQGRFSIGTTTDSILHRKKKMVKDSITAKCKGEADCNGDTTDEKKRTPRLPEKYCINKKKWIAKVSEAEKTATLAIVPGTDNIDVH
jgi:hypothetical protein